MVGWVYAIPVAACGKTFMRPKLQQVRIGRKDMITPQVRIDIEDTTVELCQGFHQLPLHWIGECNLLCPLPAQDTQPIAMHNTGNICFGIATAAQNLGHLLYISDRIQIPGRLLAAKTTVQITANGGVTRIPRQLADVVNVVHHMPYRHRNLMAAAQGPTSTDHPVVKSRADHPIPGDDRLELAVIELALMGDERPAVLMTGDDRAFVLYKRLPE